MAKRRAAKKQPATYDTDLLLGGINGVWGAGEDKGGMPITYRSALSLPPFYKAVDLISSTCGRISTPVFTEATDGSRERFKAHPAYALLNANANEYQSAFDFRKQLVADAVKAGNGWAAIERENGKPVGLYNLNPAETWLTVYWSDGHLAPDRITVHTTRNHRTIELDYSDVIHIRGLGDSFNYGLLGLSLVDCCREIIGLGVNTIVYGSTYYKNSGVPGQWVEIAGAMSPQIAERAKKALEGGVFSAGKTKVLTDGMTLKFPPDSKAKAEWAEAMDQIAIAIANITGLPPHKVGANIATSYSSLEQENLALLNDCYDAWFVRIEHEFERKLLTEAEKKQGRTFIEFNRVELTRNDTYAETDSLLKELDGGGLLLNEYLRIKNRPSAGAEGDRRRINTSITFTDMPVYDPEAAQKAMTDAKAQSMQPKIPSTPDNTDDAGDTPEDSDDDTDGKLPALLSVNLDRFLIRVGKSISKELSHPIGKKFDNWLQQDFVNEHFHILSDIIKPVNPENAHEIADTFLQGLRQELSAIPQDTIPKAMAFHQQHSADKLTKEILGT